MAIAAVLLGGVSLAGLLNFRGWLVLAKGSVSFVSWVFLLFQLCKDKRDFTLEVWKIPVQLSHLLLNGFHHQLGPQVGVRH